MAPGHTVELRLGNNELTPVCDAALVQGALSYEIDPDGEPCERAVMDPLYGSGSYRFQVPDVCAEGMWAVSWPVSAQTNECDQDSPCIQSIAVLALDVYTPFEIGFNGGHVPPECP